MTGNPITWHDPSGLVIPILDVIDIALFGYDVARFLFCGDSGADLLLSSAALLPFVPNPKHAKYLAKYGRDGFRVLQNGRVRYFGALRPAREAGEMVGRRVVREWDPATDATRTWMETLDHAGRTRIVRPTDGATHYMFDAAGDYIGTF